MTCWETVQAYAFRSLGYGERLLNEILFRARSALVRHGSQVLLGLGGFTCLPAVLAAATSLARSGFGKVTVVERGPELGGLAGTFEQAANAETTSADEERAAIEALSEIDAVRLVPGHGGPVLDWPEGMAPLDRYLGVLEDRVTHRRTGARWALESLARFRKSTVRASAPLFSISSRRIPFVSDISAVRRSTSCSRLCS